MALPSESKQDNPSVSANVVKPTMARASEAEGTPHKEGGLTYFENGQERTMNFLIPRTTTRGNVGGNKTGQTGYNLPRFWEIDFPAQYELDEIWTYYQRKGLLYSPVNKIINDTLNKWFKMYPKGLDKTKPDENQTSVIDAIEKFNDDFKVRTVLHRALLGKKLMGLSIIVFKFEDDVDDLSKPLDINKVTGFLGFEVYSKRQMHDDILVENPEKPYDITHYILTDPKHEKVLVHVSRAVVVVNDPLGDHPKGFSEILPAMDMLYLLDRGNYSLSEILYKRAIQPVKVVVPVNSNDNVLDQAEKYATDAHWMDGFVVLRDQDGNLIYDVQVIQGATDMIDIDKFTMWFMKNYSIAIGMPQAILEGVTAGAVTGSETNDRQYLSGISAIQDNLVTPILNEIYAKIQSIPKLKLIPKGDYNIVWNPMYEYSQADLTVMVLREGIRTKDLTESGYMVEHRPDGFIKNETLRKMTPEEINPFQPKPEEPKEKDKPPNPIEQEMRNQILAEAYGITPEQYKDAKKRAMQESTELPERERVIKEAMKGVYEPIEEIIRKEIKEERNDGIKQ